MAQQKRPTQDEVVKTIAEALKDVKPGENTVVSLGFTEYNPFYWMPIITQLLEQYHIACTGIMHDASTKFGEYTVGRSF
ncbi:MAG: hypothetical protein WAV51_00960 [Microgenomates group bacterium]